MNRYKIVLLARSSSSIHAFEYNPAENLWRPLPELIGFKSDEGWKKKEYYSTFRALVLNNKLIVVARGARNLHTLEYDPVTAVWRWLPDFAALQDKLGWKKKEYYSTFRALVLNNKLIVVARGAHNLHTLEYDPITVTWRWLPDFVALQDKWGWNKKCYYSTFRALVLNNKLIVIARGAHNLHTLEYDPATAAWRWLPDFAAFQDKWGWKEKPYYPTFQVVSRGDRLVVSARGAREAPFIEFNPHLEVAGAWGELTSRIDYDRLITNLALTSTPLSVKKAKKEFERGLFVSRFARRPENPHGIVDARTGDTQLHRAAKEGRLKDCARFIFLGADLENRNTEGRRPLFYLSEESKERVAYLKMSISKLVSGLHGPAAEYIAPRIFIDGAHISEKQLRRALSEIYDYVQISPLLNLAKFAIFALHDLANRKKYTEPDGYDSDDDDKELLNEDKQKLTIRIDSARDTVEGIFHYGKDGLEGSGALGLYTHRNTLFLGGSRMIFP